MKNNKRILLLTVIMGLVAVLIYGPISSKPLFAAPPSPCIENPFPWGCQDRQCDNSPETSTISCCWRDNANGGVYVCQSCDIDDNGDIGGCTDVNPASEGKSNTDVISPPPSGKAPPASTEKCPDNSAVDQNGNCTPTSQMPDDPSDNTKPTLRGNVLDDLMFSQSQDSSTSEEEQENQSNG
jgi:hypothetical protein